MSPLLACSMFYGEPKLTSRKDSGPGIESNVCDLCLFDSPEFLDSGIFLILGVSEFPPTKVIALILLPESASVDLLRLPSFYYMKKRLLSSLKMIRLVEIKFSKS